MTAKIKISIIVPAYNVENYIEDCLRSILSQNMDGIEIICIDDGSKDRTKDILRIYAGQYPQIRLIRHLKNRGLAAARNTGLSAAVGKYVWFVDADDMLVNDSLQTLFIMAENNKTDIVLFDMNYLYDPGYCLPKAERIKVEPASDRPVSGKKVFSYFSCTHTWKMETWRQFFRRDFLIKNRINFYEGIVHEDNLFFFLCMMKAVRVLDTSHEWYVYRKRAGSIVSEMKPLREASIAIILGQIYIYWNTHSFSFETDNAIAMFFEELLDSYKFYACCCRDLEPTAVGNRAEQKFLSILRGHSDRHVILTEDKIDYLQKCKKIIIYGAGGAAGDIIQILSSRKIPVFAIAVTHKNENPEKYYGINVMEAAELGQEDYDTVILVAVKGKAGEEIYNRLSLSGFKKLIKMDSVR